MKKILLGLWGVATIALIYLAYPMMYDIYHSDDGDGVSAPLILESATVDKQSEFAYDICSAVTYANDVLGYKVTFGEASRTMYQQRHYVATGRSKTYNSNHLKRRALDIQIYDRDGRYFNGGAPYKEVADYFVSLRDGNVWGGSWRTFKDTPHYERRY